LWLRLRPWSFCRRFCAAGCWRLWWSESFSVGSWLRSLAFAVTAAAAPIVGRAACGAGRPTPSFAALLGRRRAGERRDPLDWALGGTMMALILFLSKPRSAWCSIRATATFRLRR